MTILEKIKFEEDWLSEVSLTKQNIGIAFAGIRATVLEQQSCEDWYDVPSDEMTLEQARQAVKDLRKKLAEYLEQQQEWIPIKTRPMTEEEKEEILKQIVMMVKS